VSDECLQIIQQHLIGISITISDQQLETSHLKHVEADCFVVGAAIGSLQDGNDHLVCVGAVAGRAWSYGELILRVVPEFRCSNSWCSYVNQSTFTTESADLRQGSLVIRGDDGADIAIVTMYVRACECGCVC